MERAEAEAIYDAGREACVAFLVELTAGYERQIAALEERLARLEAQARQDSRTSSRPPSMDPPKTRQQRRAEARAKAKELQRREGEQRQAGGQPGHRGAGRELGPEDQIDEIVDHFPDACGGCGREFGAGQRQPKRRFGRHQVAELPPISVIWTEHRTHQLRCRHCLARTSARLPDQIAGCGFGPRLQAAVVTLTARHRVSRRGISELFGDLFGVRLATGSVDAICQRASTALAGPYLQLQDWVLDQDAVHVDETGWRTRGEGRALWTATTPDAAVFQIAEHCNREQFNTLIGAYDGIVISDRWNGYSHLDPTRRQVCWSHLQRDFRRHADGLGEQKTFGEHGVPLTKKVFAAWRAYQHEHHDRARLQAEIAPIQTALHALLDTASEKKARNRWHRQFANNLLKVWPALWTFTILDGVEPTNNPAERALRGPVIHRKLSLGTQSDNGERFAERALSAATTCRQQHRSLFTYLSELLVAHSSQAATNPAADGPASAEPGTAPVSKDGSVTSNAATDSADHPSRAITG